MNINNKITINIGCLFIITDNKSIYLQTLQGKPTEFGTYIALGKI